MTARQRCLTDTVTKSRAMAPNPDRAPGSILTGGTPSSARLAVFSFQGELQRVSGVLQRGWETLMNLNLQEVAP